MRRLILWLALGLCFACTSAAELPAGDPLRLSAQANEAYQQKRFAEAAELYVAAARAGGNKVDNAYNAACSYALAGKADPAFEQLEVALDLGLRQNPAEDPDFASLVEDPRWQSVLRHFDASHPEAKYVPLLTDRSKTSAQQYFVGREALASGVPVSDHHSLFNQYYGTVAQYVGEYDEASRIYGFSSPVDDPVAAGFDRAVDAVPVVLAKAKGRQAIFFNEAHGLAQTRASNYAMLAGLRAEGFNVLAMEALRTVAGPAPTSTHCKDGSIADTGLAARGYAVKDTGYYTQDPVYAELVRHALRLGFRLESYEIARREQNQAEREQVQAENLACLFNDNPKTRLVVLAGFSHIDEGESDWVKEGGMMARRFSALTGIDPLTVDTAKHTYLDPKSLHLDMSPGKLLAPSYVLQNAAGENFGGEQVDIALFVPAPAHRNDGEPSWLELGGDRKRVAVARAECKDKDPCLVEARRVGEDAGAVAGDRCVLGGADTGCTLFLAPGDYKIAAFDSTGTELGRRAVKVEAE